MQQKPLELDIACNLFIFMHYLNEDVLALSFGSDESCLHGAA
jgi:hypothetical protein